MEKFTNEELLEVLHPQLKETKELTTKQKVVLGQLIIYNGLDKKNSEGYFFRSNKDLTNDCDIQEKTLITAINKGYLGIFAFSDEVAYQVLASLNNQVPNIRKVYPHLHIVGFDCVSTRIPGFIDITSVDFDYDAIVQEAFEMIEDKFEHPEREKKSVMFPVTLHTRKYF